MNEPKITRRTAIQWTAGVASAMALWPDSMFAAESPPFGSEFQNLETLTTGEWWTKGVAAAASKPKADAKKNKKGGGSPPAMDVPREDVVAFALYTVQKGILKLTAQLYPLKPGEEKTARLEIQRDGQWAEIATAEVFYPGWDAHFRVEKWDHSKDVAYRVRHGQDAMFAGTIRRDPIDKETIVVANMSCNSSRTTGLRPEIVANLRKQDPDLLVFAGDQTYRHTEHTAGWIEFGLQFRDVIRDRPTVCLPDDHDVGHGNLWGEYGKRSFIEGDADGGYRYPVEYVNQVQRQQAWHLPDAVDPTPVDRGITVYFTKMIVGGVDFAILEDRKFKTGPAGKIPQMGPRPDHINVPNYDPKTVDVPGMELLGPRQERFLADWSTDWTGAVMKCALSATAFCGAVHLHGSTSNRLLADLDCNGWPQTPRKRALELLRRAWAVHLCGDQHLAVVVQHGIDAFGDGPFALTSPALVNTIYGRWWHPLDEQPGPNPVSGSPLPWTGEFKDGFGNRMTMFAYANPEDLGDEKKRADGYSIARFHKKDRTVVFECWPRFSNVDDGDKAQFPGWPITLACETNDGRKVVGYLPELVFEDGVDGVVQVIDESTGDVLYTVRARAGRFQPKVYSAGKHSVKVGRNQPDGLTLTHLEPQSKESAGQRSVRV